MSTWPQSPPFPQKLVTALKNKTCTLHSAILVYHRCLTINSVCILTFIFSNLQYHRMRWLIVLLQLHEESQAQTRAQGYVYTRFLGQYNILDHKMSSVYNQASQIKIFLFNKYCQSTISLCNGFFGPHPGKSDLKFQSSHCSTFNCSQQRGPIYNK